MSKQRLSAKQLRELEALSAMPDEAIDTDDIPEASEESWSRATRGGRPVRFHDPQNEPAEEAPPAAAFIRR